MKTYIAHILILISMFGCIGTDMVDSEMVDELIVVTPNSGSLTIGDKIQLTGLYTNMFGIKTEVEFDWIVKDSNIITIDSEGLVRAIGTGQTVVNAKFGTATSNDVLITVVDNTDDIASVIITPPSSNILQLNATLQLNARTYNVNNDELDGKLITWTSSDSKIARIDDTGLLTALAAGSVMIRATSEEVQSQLITISIGSATRTAVFSGANGYKTIGTATLKKNESGELILELSSDFETSFVLGTFIYLSHSTSGPSTKSNGLNLGEITSNGEKTFNISVINPSVVIELGTYRYVIVLCRPAGATFGIGDFEN